MRLAQNDSRYHRYCHTGPDYRQSTSPSALTGAAPRRLHLQTLRRRPLKVSSNCCRRNRSRRLSGDHPAASAAANAVGGAAAASTSSFSSAYSFNSTLSRFPHQNNSQHYSPTSLHLAYLAAQIDSRSFQSLPSKIQQNYFSPEERAYICQAYRQSLILDAADEAVYRQGKEPKQAEEESLSESEPELDSHESVDTLIPEPTITNNTSPEHPHLSTLFFDSDSESDWDTESEPDEDEGSLDSFDSLESLDSESDLDGENEDDGMDESLYDSFRWLDEDGDLDLTLDEYHNHVVNTVPKMPPRRKPSFRRTMSFGTGRRVRRATPSVSAIPTSSQSSNVPSSLAYIAAGRNSTSRPPSGQQQHRSVLHAPRASTSSIDPSAQYYQDPEARLKLRVYLASPQKFDEAVKFGFPSLDDNNNNAKEKKEDKVAEKKQIRPVPKVQRLTGTFFEDENGSVHGHREDKSNRKSSRFSVMKGPQSPVFPPPKRQSLPATARAAGSAGSGSEAVAPRRLPGNREMTLKMTLTRPDLRTTESPSTSPTSAEDPLKLDDLPTGDYCPEIWDADSDHEQNVMKKMWRKLRKQK